MNRFMVFFYLALFSKVAFANPKCDEFSKLFDQLIESNASTNNEIVNYLMNNSKSWTQAKNILDSENTYQTYHSKIMEENSKVSSQNAEVLKLRNKNLSIHINFIKSMFHECIRK